MPGLCYICKGFLPKFKHKLCDKPECQAESNRQRSRINNAKSRQRARELRLKMGMPRRSRVEKNGRNHKPKSDTQAIRAFLRTSLGNSNRVCRDSRRKPPKLSKEVDRFLTGS